MARRLEYIHVAVLRTIYTVYCIYLKYAKRSTPGRKPYQLEEILFVSVLFKIQGVAIDTF